MSNRTKLGTLVDGPKRFAARLSSQLFLLTILYFFAAALTGCAIPRVAPAPAPLHLDDIHFMVSDEAATVQLLETYFDACEMAHPDRPIDYIRFLSVRYGDPTLTITGPTLESELDPLRKRTTEHVTITSNSNDAPPHWGAHWVALSVNDLSAALAQLRTTGFVTDAQAITVPHDPEARAVGVPGPDNIPLVLVERSGDSGSRFGVDHLLLLVSDVEDTRRLFTDILLGDTLRREDGLIVLKVAGTLLVLAEPERLGLDPTQIEPVPNIPWGDGDAAAQAEVTVRAAVEHLGFLYPPGSLDELVSHARSLGYEPEYEPFRYSYLGRQTPYTVTEFLTPDGFGVEAVTVDGRVGPHAVYSDSCLNRD